MHRSRIADNLLVQLALEHRSDILLISEQYRDRHEAGWYSDLLGTAAIWIPRTSSVTITSHGTGTGHVWAVSGGITYVSVYFTPNDTAADFQAKLVELEETLREVDGQAIVAGDLNAKAVEWGMETTDRRGRLILEMAARLRLDVINEGNVTTFRRPGYGETIPDVTLASETLARRVAEWRVIEDYTGSDHQYIVFVLNTVPTRQTGSSRPVGWNVARLNEETLVSVMKAREAEVLTHHGSAEEGAVAAMRLIRKACDASMPRKRACRRGAVAAYWWTDEIANLRKRCIELRRRMTRTRRRNPNSTERESEDFKTAKKDLKRAINQSKKAKWEELRQEVNNDPWGLGYKIVTKKLGMKTAPPSFDEARMKGIVEALFPRHPERDPEGETTHAGEVPAFSEEELLQAADLIQGRKAPGPDGVPAEVVRTIATSCPRLLLHIFNRCLEEGVFPRIWKIQRLVLIGKGKGDPATPSAYRPLCMLDTIGKLFERMIKMRLLSTVENAGGLSPRQHGFRKGHSTITAIQEIVDTFRAVQLRSRHSRGLVLLATLDVKNAFNSVRWSAILEALQERFATPEYLMRIIRSYLRDRELRYETTEGWRTMRITAGAAQGSILGPDLWNVSYDSVLRMEMPDDVYLVGYADDLAAIVVARDVEDAQRRLNQAMRRVAAWMEDHGLQLATEKTEIAFLTERRIPLQITMRVGTEEVTTSATVKYLGVYLNSRMTFWDHLCYAANKASQMVGSLSRLMANVGGPTASKRRLLMGVAESVLLYGCEIWADALDKQQYRRKLAAVQKKGALRIASSYRTVSEAATLVIAGVVPIDLRAKERKNIWKWKQMGKRADREERARTLRVWQERWETERRGRWTARLIGDVSNWINREHGETGYYLTQLLSGHGYFHEYLFRMRKVDSARCPYNDSDNDDAHHTFFECLRWKVEREAIEKYLGGLSPDSIIQKIIDSREAWNRVTAYVEGILKTKKRESER